MRKRILSFDFMRAAAILIIIACHLHYYINGIGGVWVTYANQLMYIGLGIFFFISGYLLQLNDAPKIKTNRDILKFYLKKAKRLYPIVLFTYILSAVLMALFIGGYIESMSGFLSINPVTVIVSNWFVWVISIFYFVYPIVAKFPRDIWETIGISSIIFSGFALLGLWYNVVDIRVFMYYAIFIAGIFAMKYGLIKDIPYRAIAFIGVFMISIFYIDYLFQNQDIYIVSINIGVITGCIAILSFFKKPEAAAILEKVAGPIQFIAISSFCVFLIHGTIFSIAQTYIANYHLDVFKEYLFYIAVIPLTIIIGYFIQQGETAFWKISIIKNALKHVGID